MFQSAGLGLMIAGVVIQSELQIYAELIGSSLEAVSTLMMVLGILIMLVGFVGLSGAFLVQRCMLTTVSIAPLLGSVVI